VKNSKQENLFQIRSNKANGHVFSNMILNFCYLHIIYSVLFPSIQEYTKNTDDTTNNFKARSALAFFPRNACVFFLFRHLFNICCCSSIVLFKSLSVRFSLYFSTRYVILIFISEGGKTPSL